MSTKVPFRVIFVLTGAVGLFYMVLHGFLLNKVAVTPNEATSVLTIGVSSLLIFALAMLPLDISIKKRVILEQGVLRTSPYLEAFYSRILIIALSIWMIYSVWLLENPAEIIRTAGRVYWIIYSMVFVLVAYLLYQFIFECGINAVERPHDVQIVLYPSTDRKLRNAVCLCINMGFYIDTSGAQTTDKRKIKCVSGLFREIRLAHWAARFGFNVVEKLPALTTF